MKIVKLGKEKITKKNIQPENLKPNITESCLFEDDSGIVGFYLKEIPEYMKKVITFANNELLSDRVKKSKMSRLWYENGVPVRIKQYSVIIGGVKAENLKRRYKPGLSHMHLEKSAEKYIKLIYLFAGECEKLIKELTPKLYKKQLKALENQKIKIGNLWTSSIANYNIAARTHKDGGNINGAGNIIYFKKKNAEGGNLHLPGYDLVIESTNDSLVYYPAYKSIHGVDEISPTKKGGYRNSIVLYPLNIKYD